MGGILTFPRVWKFKTGDSYLQIQEFLDGEDTEAGGESKAFGLLVSRRNGIIGCAERVLRSVPASFRFPFPCLGGWKTQDMPPREGL